MGFAQAQAQAQTPARTMVFDDSAYIEQLKAENQKLRDLVIEKELELDALHQRFNCIVDGVIPAQVTTTQA